MEHKLVNALSDAKNGSVESMEYIIKRARPLIQSLSVRYSRYGFICKEEVESICFESLLEAIEQYDFGNPSFFLYAKNIMMVSLNNYSRRMSAYKRSAFSEVPFDDEYPLWEPAVPDFAGEVADKIDDEERLKKIWSIVDSDLKPEQREVIILHFVDELSIGEIAEHLGITYDAALKRRNRALERIKSVMNRRYGHESKKA